MSYYFRIYQPYCATLSKYPGEQCNPRKHQCVGQHICTIVGGGRSFRAFGNGRRHPDYGGYANGFRGRRKKRQTAKFRRLLKPPRRAFYKCMPPKSFQGSGIACTNILSCPCGEFCFRPGGGKTPICKTATCQFRQQCLNYKVFRKNIECRSGRCLPGRAAMVQVFKRGPAKQPAKQPQTPAAAPQQQINQFNQAQNQLLLGIGNLQLGRWKLNY